MDRNDDLVALLDELVTAIRMRDESDPDSHDWGVDARVRLLERRLVALHPTGPMEMRSPAKRPKTVLARVS